MIAVSTHGPPDLNFCKKLIASFIGLRHDLSGSMYRVMAKLQLQSMMFSVA